MIAKWFLVVIFFTAPDGDEASGARLFLGESLEECAQAKALVEARAAERGVVLYAECHEVKRAPQSGKPQRTRPADSASEVRS